MRTEAAVRTEITRLGIVNRGEPAMRCSPRWRSSTGKSSPRREADHHRGVVHRSGRRRLVRPGGRRGDLLGTATYIDPSDGHRKSRYLDEAAVVGALVDADCDAVWVGWGFVSELASFAQRCEEAGILFVGPDSATIRCSATRSPPSGWPRRPTCRSCPGAGRRSTALQQAAAQAASLGYPVVIKASAGGGGRGIRVVRTEAELAGGARLGARRGRARLRRPRRLRGAVGRGRAPRRGAGDRRRPRDHLGPGRARLQHPAPQPEGHRGVRVDRARHRDGGGDQGGGSPADLLRRLSQCGHGRVPRRPDHP